MRHGSVLIVPALVLFFELTAFLLLWLWGQVEECGPVFLAVVMGLNAVLVVAALLLVWIRKK